MIVDPVPVKGGMLNGNGKIGFDSKNRVVLAYHKFDANGHNQLYNARFENGAWRIYQATKWDYRWDFSGDGTIIGEIHINEVKLRNGRLEQQYSHKTAGSGILILDEETLKPIETAAPPRWPAEVSKIRSAFPEMRLNLREGRGDPGYIMHWETLPQFRDQPRPKPWPEPSLLEILRYNQP